MPKLEFRPATAPAVLQIYGHAPPFTIDARIAYADERPVGVFGFYLSEWGWTLFAEFTPEGREHAQSFTGRRLILREVRRELAKRVMRIAARCELDIPRARELLEHFGFKHLAQDIFVRGHTWQT